MTRRGLNGSTRIFPLPLTFTSSTLLLSNSQLRQFQWQAIHLSVLLCPLSLVKEQKIKLNSLSHHLKRLAQGLELGRLLAIQLSSDLLESPDRVLRVQPLTAMETDLCSHPQDGGMNPSAQEFLHFFLHELSAANRALLKWHHGYFLLNPWREQVNELGEERGERFFEQAVVIEHSGGL
jgi:hypothetical protein